MTRLAAPAALLAAALLAGCDALGIESPERLAAAREAEGRAIGAACRNAGRAIEDCFKLNLRTDKAAVVAGWIEMNDYMREHKLEPLAPVLVAGRFTPEPRARHVAASPLPEAPAGPVVEPPAEAAASAPSRARGPLASTGS